MMKAATNLTGRMHPQLFALYLGLGGIVMMFAALTSAYIVRQAAGNWLEFRLPNLFFMSTAVILISSVTLQYSYYSFVHGKFSTYKSMLWATLVLGIVFLGMQYGGWLQMENIGVYLTGNPSGSFVYAMSGLHAFHVLGGIAALLIALIFAIQLPNKVTDRRKLRFQLTLHYWHFVGVLWLYLLIFLMLQK
jgi:cytochrome c oxidase subunit 3